MDATDKRVREIVGAEAADWIAAHRVGLTATQHEAFAAWMKASPLHIEEYLETARMARDLREACGPLASSVDALIARAKAEDADSVVPLWRRVRSAIEGTLAPQRWQRAAVAIAVFAMAGIAVLLLARFGTGTPAIAPPAVAALHFETRRGEQATVHLADNSIVHLNTASAVDVRYGSNERSVELSGGEANFEVVHEAARPFRVRAGLADIVDVGTKFDVQLTGAATVVTVVEGRVSVGRAAAPTIGGDPLQGGPGSQTVLLGPNQQLTVSGSAWPALPATVDSQRATSWLQHKIVFENEPLEQVAEEFNRYSSRRIEIAAPALRTLRISGSFSTDDPAAFIAFLGTLDGVRVEVTPTRIVVLQR
jgi:transmembrane sensor